MRALPYLVLLAGCDATFRLDEVPRPDVRPAANDHDGDGFVADDNCPTVATSEQLDDDRDGIGNACDPHAGERDVIVSQLLFETDDTPGWSSAGSWTAPGAWTTPPAEVGGSFVMSTPRELYRPAIQLSFTIIAFNTSIELRELVASLNMLDGTALLGDCAFRQNTAATATSQIVIHAGDARESALVSPDYAPGTRYVGAYSRGLTSHCRLDATRDMLADQAERFTTAPSVIMKHIQVTLHDITVYQVVP